MLDAFDSAIIRQASYPKALRIAAMQAAWAASPGPSAYDALEAARRDFEWIAKFQTGGPWKAGQLDGQNRAIIQRARSATLLLQGRDEG